MLLVGILGGFCGAISQARSATYHLGRNTDLVGLFLLSCSLRWARYTVRRLTPSTLRFNTLPSTYLTLPSPLFYSTTTPKRPAVRNQSHPRNPPDLRLPHSRTSPPPWLQHHCRFLHRPHQPYLSDESTVEVTRSSARCHYDQPGAAVARGRNSIITLPLPLNLPRLGHESGLVAVLSAIREQRRRNHRHVACSRLGSSRALHGKINPRAGFQATFSQAGIPNRGCSPAESSDIHGDDSPACFFPSFWRRGTTTIERATSYHVVALLPCRAGRERGHGSLQRP